MWSLFYMFVAICWLIGVGFVTEPDSLDGIFGAVTAIFWMLTAILFAIKEQKNVK